MYSQTERSQSTHEQEHGSRTSAQEAAGRRLQLDSCAGVTVPSSGRSHGGLLRGRWLGQRRSCSYLCPRPDLTHRSIARAAASCARLGTERAAGRGPGIAGAEWAVRWIATSSSTARIPAGTRAEAFHLSQNFHEHKRIGMKAGGAQAGRGAATSRPTATSIGDRSAWWAAPCRGILVGGGAIWRKVPPLCVHCCGSSR